MKDDFQNQFKCDQYIGTLKEFNYEKCLKLRLSGNILNLNLKGLLLILVPAGWKLTKAVRVMNQTFNELKLEQHPDKTLIGRTEQGLDFLGYGGIKTKPYIHKTEHLTPIFPDSYPLKSINGL